MNSIIQDDLFRYEGLRSKSPILKIRYFLFTPGFRFTFYFRKAQLAKNSVSRLFWRICHRRCMLNTGIQIPVSTRIGKGFRISHWGTIVINGEVVIGKNFNISQGVLIGYSDGKNRGIPHIGDNVIINANAVVVGGVKIGNNVLIAPNAFVNFDVPDNSIIIGNPGRIIRRESSPTDKYMVYKLKE